MKSLIILFLSSSLLLAHALACAESSITDEEIFKLVSGKTLQDKSLSPVDSLLLLLKAEEDCSRKWSVKITGSFTGNKAGNQSTAELITSADIKKGTYPRQLRFTSRSNVRFKDKQLEEDVASLLLNYDYYMTPHVETYAFIERFKDTFLSIQQRFETGFGVKFETTCFGLVDPTRANEIEKLYRELPGEKGTLKPYKESALTSLRKREARLSLGLALSMFDELEHPDAFKARVGSTDTTLTPPSEDRFRFVIRPSVSWNVSKELSMQGYCYVKMPAFEPQTANGKYDLRVDATFLAKLKLLEDGHGNGEVSLTLRYDFSFDNAPPAVRVNNKLFEAENKHGTTSLGIEIGI